MLSSEARTLAGEVRLDLAFAGIAIDVPTDDPSFLERFIQQLLERGPI